MWGSNLFMRCPGKPSSIYGLTLSPPEKAALSRLFGKLEEGKFRLSMHNSLGRQSLWYKNRPGPGTSLPAFDINTGLTLKNIQLFSAPGRKDELKFIFSVCRAAVDRGSWRYPTEEGRKTCPVGPHGAQGEGWRIYPLVFKYKPELYANRQIITILRSLYKDSRPGTKGIWTFIQGRR